MSKLRLFFVVLFSVILTACATAPCDPIIKTETKVWLPDSEMMASFPVPPPPDKETYRSLKPNEKEAVLSRYIVDLLKVINDANVQMDILRYALHKAGWYYEEGIKLETEEQK